VRSLGDNRAAAAVAAGDAAARPARAVIDGAPILKPPAWRRVQSLDMLTLINPIPQSEPFDHPDWPFEAKSDGFRAVG
jgi:hypothetical protein